VLVAPTTIASIGEPGTTAVLHTHLHVREDALTLYGFPTRDERACFEALLGAHGVGPALALAILSVHRPSSLQQVLATDDVDGLCLVPGVGKKTAARLLLELKAKLDLPDGDFAAVLGGGPPGAHGEVREALVALGYGPEEVREALRDLPVEGDVQRLLKDALTRLSSVR
jgi:Holliday junction DNA helicase RuvA